MPNPLTLPVLEGLVAGGIDYPSIVLVEFDPHSMWFDLAFTLAAQSLRAGRKTDLHLFQRKPADATTRLGQLGLDVGSLIEGDLLRIIDSYTVQTGIGVADRPKGADAFKTQSIKVSDWSAAAKSQIENAIPDSETGRLHIDDNVGVLTRYNREDEIIDYWRTRIIPLYRTRGSILVNASALGAGSKSFHRQLQALCDGVFEVKCFEDGGRIESRLRVVTVHGKRVDPRWCALSMSETGEVGLAPTTDGRPDGHLAGVPPTSAPSTAREPGGELEARSVLDGMDRLDPDRHVIAGQYVRYDPASRNPLKDFRRKVLDGLAAQGVRPNNFLVWGPPGSGKSYLVQQIVGSAEPPVRLFEVNLANLDLAGLDRGLAEVREHPGDVVCLLDEIDSHAGEPWPFERLLPALEPSRPRTHRTVYCLAGSGGRSLAEFKDLLRGRPKGADLLSRIPADNEVSVARLGPGDRILVAAMQLLTAAEEEGRVIREVEKFALFYIACQPNLSSARQLRALATATARRIPAGEDRVRYDYLFPAGDPENKRFWNDHAASRERFSDVFLPIQATFRTPPPPATRRETTGDRPSDQLRIAILPFVNISPNPADAYFADGLTEELIATVSRIAGLRVIARTSVMRFREGARSAADAARELRVGTLLEGSVRKAGDELRVTAHLIDVRNEEPLWSITYDRHLENVFKIQEELARGIAESLHVRLLGKDGATLARAPTNSLAAFDQYLRGRARFFDVTRAGFDAAIEWFQKAVATDPGFALAHCGLAECYAIMGNRGLADLTQSLERAEASARTALRLDPELAEAHVALAPILYNRYDWAGALRELERALGLDPSNSQAHFWRAVCLGAFDGRAEEGLANALKAVELDPLNPRRRIILAQQYYWVRQYGNALTVLSDPQVTELVDGQSIQAYCQLQLGRADDAVELIQRASGAPTSKHDQMRVDHAAILGRAGRSEEARQILAGLEAAPPPERIPAGGIAWIHAGLGDFESAFAWYGRAKAERSILGVPELLVDPFVDPFRNHPRYVEVLRMFGFVARPSAG